jgi:NAD(P)-dependent dehydrogenase (short-subunit alcohol dehydrogenase family)
MPSVLITGSNRGIGLALVRRYLQAGWRVHACCRAPEQAFDLNALVPGSEGRLSVHPLEVTNANQLAALAAQLAGTPLDHLIANAGVYGPPSARLGNLDAALWSETLAVNSIAPIKLIEALVDSVAASERRVIGVLSSKMGSIADNRSGGSIVYRSSKAALNAAMMSVAIDLAPRQISCLILHPGWVQTEMGGPNAEISTEESAEALFRTLDEATPADSGRFIDIDGSTIPW